MHLSLSIDKEVILARLAEHGHHQQPVQSVSLIVMTLKYDSDGARAVSKGFLQDRGFSASTRLTVDMMMLVSGPAWYMFSSILGPSPLDAGGIPPPRFDKQKCPET